MNKTKNKKIFSKIINVFLFVLCFLFYFFRGSARISAKYPKKIVVLRWKAHMGDIVYITPLFRAIKQKYPEAKVIFIGGGRAEEVVRHNPDIDHYVDYHENFWGIVSFLRKEKIDFACLGNGGSSLGLAMLFLGDAKAISVFELANMAGDKSFSYNLLKKLVFTTPFYTGEYVPPQYMKLLSSINAVSKDVHFRLYFSKKAEDSIKDIFRKNFVNPGDDFIVGFAPGGSTENRWWPADRFAKLADYLFKEHHAKIFLIGVGHDKKAIDRMIESMEGTTKYVNLLNQSLDEFKAFISKSKLIFGNESGPMVTADAFDVPQLIFIGPTNEKEYHHDSRGTYKVLKSPDGKIESISLDKAMENLKDILENINKI